MSTTTPPGAAPPEVWAKRLGCKFDPNGPQAHRLRFSAFHIDFPTAPEAALPQHVDIRSGFPPVTNQTYNCCVAESLTGAFGYTVISQDGMAAYKEYSRLFLYYQARLTDGLQNEDGGAYIGSGAQSLTSSGICEEYLHSYSLGPFVRPNTAAYADALNHKALTVKNVDQDLNTLKDLLSRGYPVVIGFLVYPSIQSPQVESSGNIPLPSSAERRGQPLGGHAVALVGYDEPTQRFIFRNSWGTSWGDKGHGTLPYKYILDSFLSQDFWVIISLNDVTPTPVPPPTPTPTPTPTPNVPCCPDCPPAYCCCVRTRQAAAAASRAASSGNNAGSVTTPRPPLAPSATLD